MSGKTKEFLPSHEYRMDATREEEENAIALAFLKLPVERQAELLAVPVLV